MSPQCTCPTCGTQFERVHNRQRYCRPACSHHVRRPHPRPGLAERFWKHVDQSGGPDACWPWTGATVGPGYGLFSMSGVGGKQTTANRVALELTEGRPLEKHERACHHCDNPRCCNPQHLFRGTQADNLEDMRQKGRRGKTGPKGSGSLTPEYVIAIRKLYATGAWSQTELAIRFGVSQSTIGRVVLRRIWQHILD